MFWKNVVSVLTGTAMAQAIPVLGGLVIARIFSVEDFGIYSAWIGLVLIFSVISTGRYEVSLAIQKPGRSRSLAYSATIFIIFIMGLLLCLLLYIASLLKFSWLATFNSKLLIILIPTAIVIAISQTQQSLLAANGNYKTLSFYRIYQALLIVIPQVLIGFWFQSPIYLAGSHFIGVLFSIVTIAFINKEFYILKYIKKNELLFFYSRYKNFPYYSLPADFMNSLSSQLPIIVITAKFGADVGGILALTMRTLGAPIGILGKSVLDVFKKYASDEYREYGSCKTIYINTFVILTFFSSIFCVVIYYFSELLFVTFFGEEWRLSGKVAILLIPLFALRFIASPLSYIIYIVEKQNIDLLWQLGLLVMTVSVLFYGSSFNNTILMYSVGYSLLYLLYIRLTYKMSLPK